MRLSGWCALAALTAIAGPAFAQTAADHAATTAATAATALPFDPEQATREWLNTMDPAARARSDSYFEGGYWIQFVGPVKRAWIEQLPAIEVKAPPIACHPIRKPAS